MARPVVFQLNVALLEYACATVHVLDPGASTQNSYLGLGQPNALPVNVTAVPGMDEEDGTAVAVTDVQAVKFPTVNDQVKGVPLTVSATTYLTPFCSGCWGTRITPPRA